MKNMGGMAAPGERDFEDTIRPRTFRSFIGQKAVKERLEIYVRAARDRNEALDHVLLTGLPGLGKTTMAGIIANEMGRGFKETSAPAITRAGDLVGTLTSIEPGDVLFIDEIHRLSPTVEEYLYQALEDFTIDLVLDADSSARSVRLQIARFTLIGATTREGLLTKPLRDRFGIIQKIDPYPLEELLAIVERTAKILGVVIDPPATIAIASRARGTPRIANRLLRRARDVAQVREIERLMQEVVIEAMQMEGIDDQGLEETDRRILRILIQSEGPIGLKTLAAAIGEAEDTIEDVYEPHLLRQGLIQRTPRGRTPTRAAYIALGLPLPRTSDGLFSI